MAVATPKPTKITKKHRNRYMIAYSIDVIINILPILVYIIIGLSNSEVQSVQKMTLGFSIMTALILTIVNILFKKRIRSILWILVLGLNACLNDLQPLLIIIAISTICDEFILTPIIQTSKQKWTINREIDRRE